MKVNVNGTKIEMLVDTGASTDIVDEDTFCKINSAYDLKIHPPTKRIFAYGANLELAVIGQFTTCIEYDNRSVQSRIHV